MTKVAGLKMDTLANISGEIAACTDCPLSCGRTKTVPGEGAKDAAIMLIGEAPGFNEDRLGRPFVGAAGRVLDQLLSVAGITRHDVYITNTVKCRPPNNRDPLADELLSCSKYLDRQILAIDPKIIVTLGRHAMSNFLPGETISNAHGKPIKIKNAVLFPIYHPAAALHQQKLRTVIEEDIKKLPVIINEMTLSENQVVVKNSGPTEERQLGLF